MPEDAIVPPYDCEHPVETMDGHCALCRRYLHATNVIEATARDDDDDAE